MRYPPSYLQARQLIQNDEIVRDMTEGMANAMGMRDEDIFHELAYAMSMSARGIQEAIKRDAPDRHIHPGRH